MTTDQDRDQVNSDREIALGELERKIAEVQDELYEHVREAASRERRLRGMMWRRGELLAKLQADAKHPFPL